MYTSEVCLETIEYLVKEGKNKNSFSDAFPYIHHFNERGGDASLEGFINHCKNNEIKAQTNINVCRRLIHLKQQVENFKVETTDSKISSIKYQKFANKAVEEIPF